MKTIDDVELIETCGACPEQYDAKINDDVIGYLRLRHGYFSVEYKGKIVYEAEPEGDGLFTYDERDYYLTEAKKALLENYNKVN